MSKYDKLNNVGEDGAYDTDSGTDDFDEQLKELEESFGEEDGDFTPPFPQPANPPQPKPHQTTQPVEPIEGYDIFNTENTGHYRTAEQEALDNFERTKVDPKSLNFSPNEVARIMKEVENDYRVLLQFNSMLDTAMGDAELKNNDFTTFAEVKMGTIIDNPSFRNASADIANKYRKTKQSYVNENTKLATNLGVLRNFPSKANTLKAYYTLIPDGPSYDSLRTKVKQLVSGNLNIGGNKHVHDGVFGVFGMVNANYTKLREKWNEIDRLNQEVQRNLQIYQNERNAENERHQAIIQAELNEQRQAIATEQFNLFGSGSSYGTMIGLDNMTTIIMTCISEHFGGDLTKLNKFGVTDKGEIFINNELFRINNMIELTPEQLAKVPNAYVNQVKAGNWGCMFDYSKIHKFTNLIELDLSRANNSLFDAMKDLRIAKGNWGKLFKSMPSLMQIDLPEGVMNRENYTAWGKFKNMAHYVTASKEAQAKRIPMSEMGSRNAIPPAPKQKIDIEGGVNTFKNSVLWQNPVPRTLIKTFGYGVGVPMYWGLMTALGPFGLVMGAVGIGALAHHEIKHYKETGSL